MNQIDAFFLLCQSKFRYGLKHIHTKLQRFYSEQNKPLPDSLFPWLARLWHQSVSFSEGGLNPLWTRCISHQEMAYSCASS